MKLYVDRIETPLTGEEYWEIFRWAQVLHGSPSASGNPDWIKTWIVDGGRKAMCSLTELLSLMLALDWITDDEYGELFLPVHLPPTKRVRVVGQQESRRFDLSEAGWQRLSWLVGKPIQRWTEEPPPGYGLFEVGGPIVPTRMLELAARWKGSGS